jgi:hypothetical protein
METLGESYTRRSQRGEELQVSEVKRITPSQIGYWAKGDRRTVVQIAIDHGMELGAGESISNERMPDKAKDWLNEHAVTEGFRFGWRGIFFMLLPEEAWKEPQP